MKRPKVRKGMSKEEKREKRVKITLSIFISVIMATSILGILNSNSDSLETIKYNNIKFKNKLDETGNPVWTAKFKGEELSFHISPLEADSIKKELDASSLALASSLLRNSKYVIFLKSPEPNQYVDLASFELSKTLGKITGTALTKKSPGSELPVASCENATNSSPFITFETNSSMGIETDNNCITLKGNGFELLSLKDTLLYEYKGILKQEKEV